MGSLHAHRQQRDQLLGQGGIATEGKEQQLPGLQRVVDKRPLFSTVMTRTPCQPMAASVPRVRSGNANSSSSAIIAVISCC